jgi:hypothetical protein
MKIYISHFLTEGTHNFSQRDVASSDRRVAGTQQFGVYM